MTELASRSESREIFARIEKSLHTRLQDSGTLKGEVEDVAKSFGAKVWHQFKKRPSIGVVLTGGATLALATTFGYGELALAFLAAYGAYQVLREGLPFKMAAEKLAHEVEGMA